MILALAANNSRIDDGLSAARAVFSAIGPFAFNERESSNYVEGRYFVGGESGVTIRVSYGDSDQPDLPIWIILHGSSQGVDAFAAGAISSLKRDGFRVARLENFGALGEVQVDL